MCVLLHSGGFNVVLVRAVVRAGLLEGRQQQEAFMAMLKLGVLAI